MKSQLALTLIGLALIVFGINAHAQTPVCSQISFVEESFSVESFEQKQIFFTMKNTSAENFFVDTFTVGKNPFFTSESTFGKKIFADDYTRLQVLVSGKKFFEQIALQTDALLIGHFENGTRCFLDNDFFFLLKPVKKHVYKSPSLVVEQNIGSDGSGFLVLVLENQTPHSVSVKIEAQNAFLGTEYFKVNPFSSQIKTIPVNFAHDKEKVFFRIFSANGLVSEVFETIRFPQTSKPIEEPIDVAPSPESLQPHVLISSFSSIAAFADNHANAWVVVENKGTQAQNVTVELRNLPQGVFSNHVQTVLLPNEKKQVELQVNGNTTLREFSAVLVVSDPMQSSRLVVFENQTPAMQPGTAGQNAQPQNPIDGIASTAFVIITDNALTIPLILVVIIVAVLLAATPAPKPRPSWA